MFRRIAERNPAIKIKSGLMLGVGETHEERLTRGRSLRRRRSALDAGTVSSAVAQADVGRAGILPVEEFEHLGRLARQMGFAQVASGPFVRSSYQREKWSRWAGTKERKEDGRKEDEAER